MGAILAIVVALLVLGGSPQRALADPRDFTLVNGSQITLREVYVSASDVQSWREDVLGDDVLAPGQRLNITFSSTDGEADKCLYDIRVVGVDGAEGTMTGVNLCTTTTVTFS
jgi:hypothetical protein